MKIRRILSSTETLFLQAVGDDITGRKLRENLRERGVRKSAPAFYLLAAALEDEKLIKGWAEGRTIAGQLVMERHYCLTTHGKQVLNAQTFT